MRGISLENRVGGFKETVLFNTLSALIGFYLVFDIEVFRTKSDHELFLKTIHKGVCGESEITS